MLKAEVVSSIFLAVIILPVFCWGESADEEKHFITLRGRSLSIDAKEISAESIFKDLGEVCGMKIITNENVYPSSLVSVKISDVPLEEAVKKILKVTGARNYLIRYREDGNKYRISGIEFLGSKGNSRILTSGRKLVQQTKTVPKTPKKKATASSVVHSKEKKVDEEIEEIGEKFEWDDDKTAEMVKSLLRGAPPQARKYALESMTKSMDQYLKREDIETVDKEAIYEAVEDAIPSNMPGMKEKVEEYLDSLDKQ